jgi:hypothetical protein
MRPIMALQVQLRQEYFGGPDRRRQPVAWHGEAGVLVVRVGVWFWPFTPLGREVGPVAESEAAAEEFRANHVRRAAAECPAD